MRRASGLRGIALAATALAFAACGGEEGGGAPSDEKQGGEPSGGGQVVKLSADPGGALRFDMAELTVKAGKVTIAFDNPSSLPHAVEVEGEGVEEMTDTVTGANASLSADLEAGEYEFYCPVGNHRDEGMEGTLTVN